MFASVEGPLLHVVILPCQKQAYAAMNLNTTKYIQLAADAAAGTVFERGLRLFGSLDHARLLDEVVYITSEETQRCIPPGFTVSGNI
jgi:hypothetical protein